MAKRVAFGPFLLDAAQARLLREGQPVALSGRPFELLVLLVSRAGVKGGETRVFEADGPNGVRFTLHEPWSALVLDDRRVIHESTPIQPTGEHGHRDTLVLTYRAGGFQDAGSSALR